MTAYFYSRCSDVHLTRNRHDQRITKEPSLCNIDFVVILPLYIICHLDGIRNTRQETRTTSG